jgi:fatty acid desaturase
MQDAERIAPARTPWEERALVWYMRLLAIAFLAIGVYHWQSLLGAPGFVPIADMPLPRQLLTGYLAMLCLVAAVGLWMTTSWGTVVWLLVALSEIVAHVAFRDLYGPAWGAISFHLGTMAIYVVLAWRVARVVEE